VAEELALDELARQGGAVELLERALRARRELVDRARHELLARAALAGHKDARRALGRAPDLLDELLDGLGALR
jgi:hypothetical protein